MTLRYRKLQAVLAYGTGADGQGPGVAVSLAAHRISATVNISGGVGMGLCELRIRGMTLSLMNQLSSQGLLPTQFRRNTITLLAGDDVDGMAQIYQGTIMSAWADLNGAPDVVFSITAGAGFIEALLPVPASSYPGSADAAVILANLAAQMGLNFENNGVNVKLSNQYLKGSARDQALACVQAAGIEWNGGEGGVLAIWPRRGHRGGPIPLISPDTDMVSYPAFTATGIMVRTLFNPSIRFGALVEVRSSITPACGQWKVISLVHQLEAETPGGVWFTEMQLCKPDQLVIPNG